MVNDYDYDDTPDIDMINFCMMFDQLIYWFIGFQTDWFTSPLLDWLFDWLVLDVWSDLSID